MKRLLVTPFALASGGVLPTNSRAAVSNHPAGVGVPRMANEGRSEPGSLDPVLFDGQSLVVNNAIHAGLLKQNARLQPVPDLVSAVTVSADGLTSTVHHARGRVSLGPAEIGYSRSW